MMITDNRPTTPCGICGLATTGLGTRRCDRCWELERRIEADPEIAEWILGRLEQKSKGIEPPPATPGRE